MGASNTSNSRSAEVSPRTTSEKVPDRPLSGWYISSAAARNASNAWASWGSCAMARAPTTRQSAMAAMPIISSVGVNAPRTKSERFIVLR